MQSLRRGARLVKSASVPAAFFGAGYGLSWKQGREESSMQLAAVAVAGSWVGVAKGIRRVGDCLPEDAPLSQKFAKVRASELRVLADLVERFAQRGLDSAPLRQLSLRQLCEQAQADPRGSAVAGLDPDAPGCLPLLVSRLDAAAAAFETSAGEGQAAELPCLAAALHAIVAAGGPHWQDELTPNGVLHLAHAAMVGSAWLATLLRRREEESVAAAAATSAAAVPAGTAAVPSTEVGRPSGEEEVAAEHMATVWQALAQLPSRTRVGLQPARGRGADMQELHRDLEERLVQLKAAIPPPPRASLRPNEAVLPSKLQRNMAIALRGARGADPAPRDKASQGGVLRQAVKALQLGAWLLIIGGGVVAVSDDGFRLMDFSAVPEQYRPWWKALLGRAGESVGEVMSARHGSLPRTATGSAVGGGESPPTEADIAGLAALAISQARAATPDAPLFTSQA